MRGGVGEELARCSSLNNHHMTTRYTSANSVIGTDRLYQLGQPPRIITCPSIFGGLCSRTRRWIPSRARRFVRLLMNACISELTHSLVCFFGWFTACLVFHLCMYRRGPIATRAPCMHATRTGVCVLFMHIHKYAIYK